MSAVAEALTTPNKQQSLMTPQEATKAVTREAEESPESVQAAIAAYNTQLKPEEETQYQTWRTDQVKAGKIHPLDDGRDYDMRGAWKDNMQAGGNGHWDDTYKKPNHETFSVYSKYATGDNAKYAGTWSGEGNDAKYTPSKERYQVPTAQVTTQQSLLTGGK